MIENNKMLVVIEVNNILIFEILILKRLLLGYKCILLPLGYRQIFPLRYASIYVLKTFIFNFDLQVSQDIFFFTLRWKFLPHTYPVPSTPKNRLKSLFYKRKALWFPKSYIKASLNIFFSCLVSLFKWSAEV